MAFGRRAVLKPEVLAILCCPEDHSALTPASESVVAELNSAIRGRQLRNRAGRTVKRTLEGGSDEEILEWCFARGRQPSGEEIEIWNAFLAKRGWRDEGSEELMDAKKRNGWENRDDIQTWVDLHDAEEGRTPRRSIG